MIVFDVGTAQQGDLFADIMASAGAIVIVAATNKLGLEGAAETISWLQDNGPAGLLERAVLVLNTTTPGAPLVDLDHTTTQFAAHVPTVVRIGYDPRLAAGTPFTVADLSRRTQLGLTALAAALADYYPPPARPEPTF